MKKKYAFLLMGPEYEPAKHQATLDTPTGITYFRTVRNPEEAKATVLQLAAAGVGAIELCGAFGKELARELVHLTENKVAIGYVVHDTDQNKLFDQFFPDNKSVFQGRAFSPVCISKRG